MAGIFSLLSGGLIGQISGLAKIFFGDKEQRDSAIADEMKAIQESYRAELMAPEKIGYWASFIDGINRLVRPFYTFGTMSLFIWAAIDPVSFQVTMVSMGAVPEMLWYICLTIISFWFGGRMLEKAPRKINALTPKALETLLVAQKELRKLDPVDSEQVIGGGDPQITPIVVPSEPAVESPSIPKYPDEPKPKRRLPRNGESR